jgi:hypothetical protein
MMNQATSRRLRTRCLLLLLLPLSLANAQPIHFRLELYNPPSSLTAGDCGSVVVKLKNAQGNDVVPSTPVLVSLSSTHPHTGLFYEREGCSTPPVSSVYIGPNSYFRQLWFRDTLAGEVTLSASLPGAEGATSSPIRIQAGSFHRLVATPLTSGQVEPCGEVRIELTAEDSYGNIVPEPSRLVRLCKAPGSSAIAVASTLGSSDLSAECPQGQLSGRGNMTWRNSQGGEVAFTPGDSTTSYGETRATWRPPLFAPERSTLAFIGTNEPTPRLPIGGQLRLQFEPRNTCGGLSRLPGDKNLDFTVDAPLRINSLTQESDGRWTASVSLLECPSSGQEQLSLWPTLDGQKILIDDDDEWLERKIRPLCLSAGLQLSLRPEQQELKGVEPGARLDFAVELRNTGPLPLPAGRLKVSLVDLSGLELALGEQPLAQSGEYFVLPALDRGATLTLKSKVEAAFKSPLSVKAQAWYGTADGVKLAEEVLTLEAKPEVDVGCGCHSGPLASHWLALLVLASRSRAQSVRLRRSERIERQAPCRQ